MLEGKHEITFARVKGKRGIRLFIDGQEYPHRSMPLCDVILKAPQVPVRKFKEFSITCSDIERLTISSGT